MGASMRATKIIIIAGLLFPVFAPKATAQGTADNWVTQSCKKTMDEMRNGMQSVPRSAADLETHSIKLIRYLEILTYGDAHMCFPGNALLREQRRNLIKNVIDYFSSNGFPRYTGESFIQYIVKAGMRSEALKLLEEQAEKGSIGAQLALGNYYKKGNMNLFIVQNMKSSVEYFRKAASQKDSLASIALNELGEAYENGLGVAQNYREAHKFYRLAAQSQHPYAMVTLATLYVNGKIPRDLERAYIWFNLAAERFSSVSGSWGVKKAKEVIIKRDQVAQMLTKVQLQNAQDRSSACTGSSIIKCD